VLTAMTTIVALACVAMQFIRAEDTSLDPVKLFMPFALIALPPLLMTSAIAVFFETMPVLRGGIGNIAFIFVWGAILGGNLTSDMATPHNDPLGSGIVLPDMFVACKAAYPDFVPSKAGVSMGINISEAAWHLSTFTWDGVDWTMQFVMWRLSWVLAALGIAAVAAVPFDRFDPAQKALRIGRRRRATRTLSGEQSAAGRDAATRTTDHREDAEERVVRGASQVNGGHAEERVARGASQVTGTHAEERVVRGASQVTGATLTRLTSTARRAQFLPMLMAEWKLIVRGLRWWWIGPLGLSIAALTAPLAGVKAIVLPLAWFWPVLRWSRLGTREAVYNTGPLFFSSPHPLSRQLTATWLAGVMLSVLTGFAVALRFALAGDSHALLAWCVGAAFVPALAIALGVWTGSGKAFEAIYTGLCYAVIQSAAPLDFMGAVESAPRSNPLLFAILTAVLLATALAGRQRRLQN